MHLTFVTYHSFRGGTGKTMLSVNTAAYLAKKGKNVCLLEFDFSGPSLNSIFEDLSMQDKIYWVNDFIDIKCTPEDILIDLSKKYHTNGKFFVGFANPDIYVIKETLAKGRKWQMKALSQLIDFKKYVEEETDIDHVILDTSPGMQYSSINAIAVSDVVLIVLRLDKADFDGTISMIEGIHNVLNKRSFLVINRAIEEMINTPEKKYQFESLLGNMFSTTFDDDTIISILGWIPCYCSVAAGMNMTIFAFTEPNHPFMDTIESFLPIFLSEDQ